MKIIFTIFIFIFFVLPVSAFQDECSVEGEIVTGFRRIYADELNKAMSKVKELDPEIEKINQQINIIEHQVDSELIGATVSRILVEKINRTEELIQKKDSLLRQQNSSMNSANIYKESLNNALYKLYVCRYSVLQELLSKSQNILLTNSERINIIEMAIYYSDDKNQKEKLGQILEQLKQYTIKKSKETSVQTPSNFMIINSNIDFQGDKLKKRAETQFNKYKSKFSQYSPDFQKNRYNGLLVGFIRKSKTLKGDNLTVNNLIIELINTEIAKL